MDPGVDAAFTAHGVAVAYLFGSRAEGTARPQSDHDVAVLFTRAEPAFDATERLAADLAAPLGTGVDVVDLARADLELRGRVAESGRLLFSADEVARVRFEVDDALLARSMRDGGLDDLGTCAVRIAALTT